MIDKEIGSRCTACSSCMNSCAHNAIELKPDKEGFLYPIIDNTKCVKCEVCIKKCSIINPVEGLKEPEVYSAWNKNKDVRILSTSGGVFSSLATNIILSGGLVAGAIYDENLDIRHVLIDDLDGINKLRQSKYAQSDLMDLFPKIKTYLNKGKKVLFCGTPCQCAGLRKYLGHDIENLVLCDFICRGVVSPKVYRKFLNDMEHEYGAKIKSVQFKNKDYGWNQFSTKIIFRNNKVYQKDRNEDYYMRGFLRHNLYLRPSCHECNFKSIPRVSDISLGDFWGIGSIDQKLDSNEGTSVVMINSIKGKRLFESTQQELEITRRSLDEVISGNSCVLNSVEVGQYRSFFFLNLERYSFSELIRKIDRMSEQLTPYQRILRLLYKIRHFSE